MTALSFSTKSHKSLDCSNRPHVTADIYRRGGTHKRPIELVGDRVEPSFLHGLDVRLLPSDAAGSSLDRKCETRIKRKRP